jgi:hypothetical protein
MLCARDAMPLAEEVTGSKGPISLAWAVGAGVAGTVGGRDGDWE